MATERMPATERTPLVPPYARRTAEALVAFGGALLLLAVAITVASVVGRALPTWAGPVPGDVELVRHAVGIAVFAFLPYCQLVRGHASVDLAVDRMGPRARRASDLAASALLSIATAVLLWRLCAGMVDKRTFGETTFILRLPVWWFYLPAAACLGAALMVTLHTAWADARALFGHRVGEAR